jgi:hypothetical protein
MLNVSNRKQGCRRIIVSCLTIAMLLLMFPSAFARDSESTRKGTSLYPLYWIAYEPCFTADAPLDEARWKANIDWAAESLLPHGYNMVTTDGWLGGSTQTTANGYLLKYNDNWEHGWQYWADYCNSKGLDMGVYYNPLWIIDSVRDDPSKTVIGTNIPVQDIYTAGFADVTKTGAKEYIQGYVNYFKDMGVRFLRVDFLCWYETGAGSGGAPAGVPAWGSENYATALRWIAEAAGDDMEVSLVMPNSLNHAANEVLYGDLMRVDTDTTNGDWTWLNKGSFGDERQTWNDRFCQWANPFQGLTGFSDIGGRGNLTLDGDFLRIQNFTGPYADNEKRTAISLFTMAGSPLALASQYDTIGNNLSYLTNPEILALKKDGFVGKPIYYNGNPFEPAYSGQPDTGSRDSERWIGQTSRGDWIVALFNRSDNTVTKSIDFAQTLGLSNGGSVHDVWNKTNLGAMSGYSVSLAPHDVSMIIITPERRNTAAVRYEAEVASFRNGAHFNNDHTGRSGNGFVDRLSADYAGANVLFGVYADYAGTHQVSVGYANATGTVSTGKMEVRGVDNQTLSSAALSLPALSTWDNWGNVTVSLNLQQGLNLITVTRGASDTGAFNLDYIDVQASGIVNPGFEAGNLSGWTATGSNLGVDAGDVFSGSSKCYFWSSSAFTQKIDQTVSLPNGTYMVSAMVKQNSGTPTICRMELSGFGAAASYTDIPHNDSYVKISNMVTVTNGQLNVAFYESATGAANLQIDDISITPCGNVENYGFETGDFTGWTTTGTNCGVDGSDVYQGNYKCYFWSGTAFTQKIAQTVTGLSNGLHTVTAWVKQYSGTPSTCQMEISGYGGATTYSGILHGNEYVQISATVYVTNGELTITFNEVGTNCNLQIDNIQIN